MPLTDVTAADWDLRCWIGSTQAWTISMAAADGFTVYPTSGSTWEYVVHASASDTTKLITITTTSSAAGVITVLSTAAMPQLQLTLNPAATSGMSAGTYYHALWQNPSTTTARAVFTGAFYLVAAPQP